MKQKILATIVIASVMGVGNAVYAGNYEITNPLFTPDKGELLSESTYTFKDYKCKSGSSVCLKEYTRHASEEFAYGISDKLVLYAGADRDFYKHTYGRYKQYEDKIITNTWNAALKYKLTDNEKTYWDFTAKYYQAHVEEMDIDKYYSVSSTFGQNGGFGTLYVTAAWDNTLNHGKENDGIFTGTFGWNKNLCGKFSMGADVTYRKDSDIDKAKMLDAGINFAYRFTDKIAFNVFGRQILDSDADLSCFKYKNGYTVGAGLRFLF